MNNEQGKLVVVSGPSGVGKSTVVRKVLQHFGGRLRLSVSATTRQPRPGEADGVDYHFLTDEEFARRREQGDFVECIEVFGRGHWYGTLWNEVRPFLEAGKWVLLEVDVDGAENVPGPAVEPAITALAGGDTVAFGIRPVAAACQLAPVVLRFGAGLEVTAARLTPCDVVETGAGRPYYDGPNGPLAGVPESLSEIEVTAALALLDPFVES